MDLTEQIDMEFLQMASLPDEQIDLARGALLIAKTAYPDLDEAFYLERLNRLSAGLMNSITDTKSALDKITKINRLLFDREKLLGNRENYYDPDNSFLNRVMDRKLGIPITLSLIYVEVAGRLGLDVRGIGLPGHFITALYHSSERIFIDPFHRGEIRTIDECHQIARRNLGESSALLYEAMGNPAQAINDWTRYVANISDFDSEKRIQTRIDNLKKQKPRIH